MIVRLTLGVVLGSSKFSIGGQWSSHSHHVAPTVCAAVALALYLCVSLAPISK